MITSFCFKYEIADNNLDSVLPDIITWQPSTKNLRAIAKPIPLEAPVMSIVLFLRHPPTTLPVE